MPSVTFPIGAFCGAAVPAHVRRRCRENPGNAVNSRPLSLRRRHAWRFPDGAHPATGSRDTARHPGARRARLPGGSRRRPRHRGRRRHGPGRAGGAGAHALDRRRGPRHRRGGDRPPGRGGNGRGEGAPAARDHGLPPAGPRAAAHLGGQDPRRPPRHRGRLRQGRRRQVHRVGQPRNGPGRSGSRRRTA